MSVLAEVDPAVAYPATTPDMGEAPRHVVAQFLAYGALRRHFAGRRDCFVGQEFNVYYRPVPNTAFVVPDVLVCFGVDPRALGEDFSYRIWDAGAPPSFVLEVASQRTSERDREEKPDIYLEVGVDEYWRFDPTGGDLHAPALQGDRRVGGALEPIEAAPDGEGRLHARSRVLGLDLHAEAHRLRFRDPQTGLWLPDPDDARHALDDIRHALDETRLERDTAEAALAAAVAACRAAEGRAEAAEAESAALRARLNDRGGDTPR
ncbi:MAG: Uma2 family endonuclease [bacterium]|nr:Uma2 family endonuclease [bacterium]